MCCKGPNARLRSRDFTLQAAGKPQEKCDQLNPEVHCGCSVGRSHLEKEALR